MDKDILGAFLVFFLSSASTNSDTRKGVVLEYCQSESFRPSCGSDEVIVMVSGRYGRLRLGRCVSEDFGYLGCVHDVMSDLDGACSGRRKCDIRIDETTFPVAQPCHKDLKSYLEASYECLKVTMPRRQANQYSMTSEMPVSGILASISTEESGHGDADTPWIIKVPSGQSINISLWDFGLKAARNRSTAGASIGGQHGNDANLLTPNSNNNHICRVYATIKEKSLGRSVTVCGGRARHKHVYTSDTNEVEIRILSGQAPPNQAVYFLLEYQAVGCADPRAPVFGWAKRYGSRVKMGCTDDKKITWELHCINDAWQGAMGNCTKATADDTKEMAQTTSLPHGVAVAVVITIAFLIGAIVLLIGLFCLKCKSRGGGHRQVTYKCAAGGSSGNYDTVEKRSLKTTVIGHASMAVTTEVNPRENEYASMKYLREQTDTGEEENNINHSQETYAGFAKALSHPCTCGGHHHHHHLIQKCPCGREHSIYESPESGRKILKPDIIAADAPQFFDLDPDINLKEAHPLYFIGKSAQEL